MDINSIVSQLNVPQKRKYTRRIKTTTTTGGKETIRLHGIQLQVDPECIEQMKNQQIADRQKEFRNSVQSKFQNYIDELKKEIRETGEIPESLELPKSVGIGSADFSSNPTKERVLIPGNDYAIRVHVGLMSLMEWSVKTIAEMQKEIVDLKSQSGGGLAQFKNIEVPLETNVVQPA